VDRGHKKKHKKKEHNHRGEPTPAPRPAPAASLKGIVKLTPIMEENVYWAVKRQEERVRELFDYWAQVKQWPARSLCNHPPTKTPTATDHCLSASSVVSHHFSLSLSLSLSLCV
jgi:hypothetical protein